MNNIYNKRAEEAKVAYPLSEEKRVYTLQNMAKMFHVSVRTIYNWLDQGRFSFIKVGCKTYLTEENLQEFLTNHQVKSFDQKRRLS